MPYFTTFSGADIVATITVPGYRPYTIGELQTITYSVHREKGQVRALGFSNPRGYTYGARTIAGSLIFTVFDRHVVYKFMNEMHRDLLIDEMPPFDVTVTFANEYGYVSSLAILGITIVDEGQTMSIEDIYTENVMSYYALDISPMKDVTPAPSRRD
jgi:hypothetical protein